MYLCTECSVVHEYVKLHVIGMLFGKVLNFYLGRGIRRKGDLYTGFVFVLYKIAISCAILFFLMPELRVLCFEYSGVLNRIK